MKLVFQGDSITDGGRLRDKDWDLNHIFGHGYVFSIAAELGALYPEKDYCFLNRGASGDRITDLSDRWEEDTLKHQPDVISVLVGTNDLVTPEENGRSISTDVFERTYDLLLAHTFDRLPGVRIVLCEPFRMGTSANPMAPNTGKDLAEKQEVVQNLSQKYNTVFVPLQRVFDEACKRREPEYWLWDGIHPTAAGHYLITRQWLHISREKGILA